MNQTDYYAVLDVSEQATADEIKRAYFRKVREHSPEEDPTGFQLVRTAYETLSDPQKRSDYDATRAFGGQIREWMDEAVEAMEDEEFDTAIDLLKRVVALNPHAYAAWDMLGSAYFAEEEYGNARRVFLKLVQEQPDVASHHLHLGACLLEEDDLAAARSALRRAHELQPYNAQPCILLSRSYRESQDWEQAIQWLERAIGADGKEDMFDFDALVELATTYVLMGEPDRVHHIGIRAEKILPADPDARRYGAHRFAAVGAMLHQARAFQAAAAFFAVASRLAPHDAQLREIAHDTDVHSRALRELDRLVGDREVVEPLKPICAYMVYGNLGLDEAKEIKPVAERAARDLSYHTPFDLQQSVRAIERKYPAVYELASEFFRETNIGRGGTAPRQQASSDVPDGCIGCGCWILIGIAVLAFLGQCNH